MSTIEERVNKLEKSLEEFVKTVDIEFNKSYHLFSRPQIEVRKGCSRFGQELAEANDIWRKKINDRWGKFKQELIERKKNWQRGIQRLREEFAQELKERIVRK